MSDGLVVRDLRVTFGGVVAVDDASLEAPLGRVTGLIGPNGAGKTTTFNACSGLVRPSEGRVELLGRDVTRVDPAGRARDGLGRTFQHVEICSSMSVRSNVAVGAEARLAGRSARRQLLSSRADRQAVVEATDEALDLCGLTDVAEVRGGRLSTGQKRFVELARALAGRHRVLLLDEPSSGLDDEETRRFGAIVTRAVTERNLAVLLVEHDMALVMSLCDHIFVLDFGRMIFDGNPAAVSASSVVRDAYLGVLEDVAAP